jgi:DNA modification methylase
MGIELNRIYHGHCMDLFKQLDDESIDSVITSPPYWQLRDYKWDGQWGLEPTFKMYLENLWSMMDEVWRVLKPTGTVWVNLGDTYNGNKKGHTDNKTNQSLKLMGLTKEKDENVADKCLLLIPHRFAIGCIDRGWIIRNDIIWAKRNGMPESCIDRFSKKHEYFFLMVKSQKYYFDLDGVKDRTKTKDSHRRDRDTTKLNNTPGRTKMGGLVENNYATRNPGTVSDFWDIPTVPSSDEHYAAYNDKLIGKPIVAGCPQYVCNKCGNPREKIIENTPMVINLSSRTEKMGLTKSKRVPSGTMVSPAINKVIGLTDCGCNEGFSPGVILDPFCGTATTGCRALELGRNFIGFEGSEKFVKMGNKNLLPYLQQTKLF